MTAALATIGQKLSVRFGMGDNTTEVLDILKNTAFKGGNVTDAQMTSLMIVADQYGLNPWTREIYAFPDKGGIVPVVGVDGWSRIINEHPQFDGLEFEQNEESCTCIMYRKDRRHPIKVTEWLAECKRNNAQPWQSHPKRMLRHKSLIQCARLAFGFVGIYDQDEAERIIDSGLNTIDGTTGEIIQKRTTPQSASQANVADGYDAYEKEILPTLREAAKNGSKPLEVAFFALEKSPNRTALWTRHSLSLKDEAATADFVNAPNEVTE